MLTVREIWRYPVKSLGGERLQVTHVGEHGISGDRSWGVRDETNGTILTGRREPRLLMASARLDGGQLVIDIGESEPIISSAELSAWLDRPVELVRAGAVPTYEGVHDIETEQDWESWQGREGSFHDGHSTISLGSTTSMAGHDPRRFRLNLILDHDGDGTEDDLIDADLTIGGAGLYVRKPIERCVMVTRAQPGLDRDLSVLKRVVRERNNLMGVGAVVSRAGQVSVGDVVMPFSRS